MHPWSNEPDDKDWECAGFKCQLRRNHSGAWCGYVGLPKEHPLHGIKSDEKLDMLKEMLANQLEEPIGENPGFTILLSCLSGHIDPTPGAILKVHWGITWSDYFRNDNTELWWYGFDCSHCDDMSPGRPDYGTYRDIEYATKECENLAHQLNSIVEVQEALGK